MKTTNITQLRAHLGKILDSVRRGEEVEIYDRKVPIARLVPIKPSTPARKGKIPPWLEKLQREGKVTVGTMEPYTEILKGFPPGTKVCDPPASDVIIEERRTGR